MGVGLEQELDPIGRVRRDDGQPSVFAGGHVRLLHEAEDIGVEGERLVLVIDQDARGHDFHRSCSFCGSGQRSAISCSGVVLSCLGSAPKSADRHRPDSESQAWPLRRRASPP
jgi:hypothetical protein